MPVLFKAVFIYILFTYLYTRRRRHNIDFRFDLNYVTTANFRKNVQDKLELIAYLCKPLRTNLKKVSSPRQEAPKVLSAAPQKPSDARSKSEPTANVQRPLSTGPIHTAERALKRRR